MEGSEDVGRVLRTAVKGDAGEIGRARSRRANRRIVSIKCELGSGSDSQQKCVMRWAGSDRIRVREWSMFHGKIDAFVSLPECGFGWRRSENGHIWTHKLATRPDWIDPLAADASRPAPKIASAIVVIRSAA